MKIIDDPHKDSLILSQETILRDAIDNANFENDQEKKLNKLLDSFLPIAIHSEDRKLFKSPFVNQTSRRLVIKVLTKHLLKHGVQVR